MKKEEETVALDWRIETMSLISKLFKQADPEVIEEMKYKKPSNPEGVFVWSHDGMISTGETYKNHLRLTFAKGPSLKDQDPKGLINAYRAMIIHEEDKLDEAAFKNLIRAAVELNRKSKSNSKPKK
jgi:hypothetical protein